MSQLVRTLLRGSVATAALGGRVLKKAAGGAARALGGGSSYPKDNK